MKAFHILAASTGVLAFGAMAMAAPVTILSQNFDSSPFTNGATIGTTVVGDSSTVGGGWNTNSPSNISGGTLPVVTTDTSHSGSQSLKMTYSHDGNDAEVNLEMYGQNTSAAAATTGDVITSFYVNSAGGIAQLLAAKSFSGPKNPRVDFNGGKIIGYSYDDNGASTSHTLTTGLSNGEWYGIEVITHVAAKNYDIYLDSGSGFTKLTSTPLSVPGLDTTQLTQAVTFKPKGSVGAYYYIDDVSITQVPEPASAALLVLGGSALLLKRRRR